MISEGSGDCKSCDGLGVIGRSAHATLLACATLMQLGCGAAVPNQEPAMTSRDPYVGEVTREAIESGLEPWRLARETAAPDASVAAELASVTPGAEVIVVLGVWCGDSRREVPRLWRALDLAGGSVPFSMSTIGVDRARAAPGGLVDGLGIDYVPTIIVRREGREVGRIVESAPGGIERALRDLLTGTRTGVISGRAGVGAP